SLTENFTGAILKKKLEFTTYKKLVALLQKYQKRNNIRVNRT
ncbi:13270_t:CDS:1, partial [Dentiscutata erythropus]